MSVAYICPHCRSAGKAPDRLSGREATCPGCRNVFTVPTQPPLAPPPPEPIFDAPLADESAPVARQVELVVRLILWMLCLLGIVVCFGLFVDQWGRVNNVMQQAAIGVQFCFYLMCGFFFVYALDRLLLGRR